MRIRIPVAAPSRFRGNRVQTSPTVLAAVITSAALVAATAMPACGAPPAPVSERPASAVSVQADPQAGQSSQFATVAQQGAAATPPLVRFEMAMMAKCPYANQAIAAVKGMRDVLGSDVEIAIDYIGTVGAGGELGSMHGPTEVEADMAQVCARRMDPPRHLDLLACQAAKGYAEAQSTWEPCLREIGLPVEAVRHCMQSGEGQALLAASFARTQQKGISGSPTFAINGQTYSGPRKANDFLHAVCASIDPPSAACRSIPMPARVNITILTDRRCTDCDASRYETMLKVRIGNPSVRIVDYGDPEGKRLYTAIKPGNLPVLVFDATLEQDRDALDSLLASLKPADPYRWMGVGGQWDPSCQTGAECARPECSNKLNCRREIPNRLDVYIMSQCPFAVKGLDAMQEVLKDFGPVLDFHIHYIGDGDAKSGFKSMHGQGEVDEDRRELCSIQYYGAGRKYLDYIWCRNKEIRIGTWESCTGQGTGLDTNLIRTCASGPLADRLLAASYKASSDLGIGASPTWLVNNKFKHAGIDAAAIRTFVCEHNAKLKICTTLPKPPAPSSAPAPANTPGCQ